MPESPLLVGIEGAQAAWEVALRPSAERGAGSHEEAGVAPLVARVQALRPVVIVLEATGGWDGRVTRALAAAAGPVAGVTPRQARDFAPATGPWATTAAVEARAVAPFAAAVRPARRPVPEAQPRALSAQLTRRRPLVQRLTAAKNRVARGPGAIRAAMQAQLTGLEQRLADLDTDIGSAIRASPLWREPDDLWHSRPGVGPGLSRTLWADLPALGTLSRQPIAAVVGVAPRNRDRGGRRGKRTVWGGRALVRRRLSRGPLVAVRYTPVLNTFYHRLCTAGKAPNVALTAAMRKLLPILTARLKQHTPWRKNDALTSGHVRQLLPHKTGDLGALAAFDHDGRRLGTPGDAYPPAGRYSPSPGAQLVGVPRGVVRQGFRRFRAQRLDGLADAPGRGAKGDFAPRVAIHVVRLACERPDPLGRSFAQGDGTERARQLLAASMVADFPHLSLQFA